MNARILSREEWEKLAVTGFEQLGKTLRPEDSQIAVVEEDGKIVATLGVFRVTHFESLWIAPEYRGNAGVVRRLVKAAVSAARKWTDNWVWGASDTPQMDDVIGRTGGVQLPIHTYMIPLGGN